jgi:hypothetical protein
MQVGQACCKRVPEGQGCRRFCLGRTLYIITVDSFGNRLLAILHEAFRVLIGAHVSTRHHLFVVRIDGSGDECTPQR